MSAIASRTRWALVLTALAVGCAGKTRDVAPPPAPPPPSQEAQSSGPGTDAPDVDAPCSGDDDCSTQQGTAQGPNPAEEKVEKDPYAACMAGDDLGSDVALHCQRGALEAYQANDFKTAETLAKSVCTETTTAGCGLLGVLHAKGEGVPQDVVQARGYLVRACEAKDAEACGNLEALDAAVERARVANVLPVEGANVSIGSIGVDGLQATNLQCRREGGGGLFGGAMGAISGIAKRKKRLMACGSEPQDVRVRWTTAGGRIKTVEVEASSKKVNSCVKKALKGASAAFGGTCAATFSIGK